MVELVPTAVGKSLARFSFEDIERMTKCGMSYDEMHRLAIQEEYAEMEARYNEMKENNDE